MKKKPLRQCTRRKNSQDGWYIAWAGFYGPITYAKLKPLPLTTRLQLNFLSSLHVSKNIVPSRSHAHRLRIFRRQFLVVSKTSHGLTVWTAKKQKKAAKTFLFLFLNGFQKTIGSKSVINKRVTVIFPLVLSSLFSLLCVLSVVLCLLCLILWVEVIIYLLRF